METLVQRLHREQLAVAKSIAERKGFYKLLVIRTTATSHLKLTCMPTESLREADHEGHQRRSIDR